MGQFFSDPVEQALQYIYYDLQVRRGQDGFHLLQQAAEAGMPTPVACWDGVCMGGSTSGPVTISQSTMRPGMS